MLTLFVVSFTEVVTRADDTSRLIRLFDEAKEYSIVTIPPGDYFLEGKQPIGLKSNLTVVAKGARFLLPSTLEDEARIVLFRGENIRNFQWQGGHFIGNVFDPANPQNSWPPNANTRAIVVNTTAEGVTSDLMFSDISSNGLAGAAVTVLGAEKAGNERETVRLAKNVTMKDCTLERTGKFMWDYGFLWQILVWPEEYSEAHERLLRNTFVTISCGPM